jgi:hypothetical protein
MNAGRAYSKFSTGTLLLASAVVIADEIELRGKAAKQH